MAKMVGLSRKLKLPWLKYTVDLVADGTSESEIKDKLNEYLSYEIESPTVLRKTREILMNIWVYDNPYSSCLKSEAVQLIEKYPCTCPIAPRSTSVSMSLMLTPSIRISPFCISK